MAKEDNNEKDISDAAKALGDLRNNEKDISDAVKGLGDLLNNKQAIPNLAKEFQDNINKQWENEREEAQYTKTEVLQMRSDNDSRLYETPDDVNNNYSCVWENGKYGYFIPFEHRGLDYDFIPPPFGGQKDGKGLRFVQKHKKYENKFFLSLELQSRDIIISGFGEYVLENWGKDLLKLCEKYTYAKLQKRIEQWKKDNYPNEINKATKLLLIKDLRESEHDKWDKATISEFFSLKDNDRLNQCMATYFEWIDKLYKDNETPQSPPTLETNVNKPSPEVVEQPKPNANEENKNKLARTIDIDKLKIYFIPTFKGMGNNNINYFDWFIEALKTDRTSTAFAQIALMCYEGNQMNRMKPTTFQGWYKIFCECVGCERKTFDNKNKLRNGINENLKKEFNYLK